MQMLYVDCPDKVAETEDNCSCFDSTPAHVIWCVRVQEW
jgi:hypothetical protein